jgi:hypothetical protein
VIASTQSVNHTTSNLKDRKALIALFRELSAHGLYPLESMRKWLLDCGFNAEIHNNQNELFAFDRIIARITGDWGSGVYPLHVLEAAICFYKLEDTIRSEMTGRGFMYNDLIDQLEKAIIFNRGNG